VEEAVVTVAEVDKSVAEAGKTVEAEAAEAAVEVAETVTKATRNQNGNPKPTWAAW
jgi:hypothetical protein